MLRDVQSVKTVTQRHEDAAMLGVLLGDLEPEHVAVEALGGLLVDDSEEDVTDPSQFDHRNSPAPARSKRYVNAATRRAVSTKLSRWPTRHFGSKLRATRRSRSAASRSRSLPISTGYPRPTCRPAEC